MWALSSPTSEDFQDFFAVRKWLWRNDLCKKRAIGGARRGRFLREIRLLLRRFRRIFADGLPLLQPILLAPIPRRDLDRERHAAVDGLVRDDAALHRHADLAGLQAGGGDGDGAAFAAGDSPIDFDLIYIRNRLASACPPE